MSGTCVSRCAPKRSGRQGSAGELLFSSSIVVGIVVALVLLSSPAQAKSRRSAAASLDAQVLSEVRRTLPSGLAISSITLPASLVRHSAKSDIVSLSWRRAPRRGRSIVQVLIHKRRGRIVKGWARIELVELGKVLVAAVDLEAGSIIRAGQLRVEIRPRVTGRELGVEPSYVVGSRVVIARKKGDTLAKDDVSMPLPVARGASVRVVVHRSGVTVATTGVLESTSRVGTVARVRVSGKLLSGQLTLPDLVELGVAR